MSIDEEAEPRPRGRPRSAEKEAAIVDAAMRLFLENGFSGVSVDAIAEAAGVSKVTIYARFGDKDSLFHEVLRRKCARFMDSEQVEISARADVRAGLIEIARRFLGLILDPQSLALYRIMAAVEVRDRRMSELFFRHAVEVVCAEVTNFLVRETEKGRLAVADPRGAAWRFLGAVQGEAHMRALLGVTQRSAEELDQHVSACVDDLIRAHGGTV